MVDYWPNDAMIVADYDIIRMKDGVLMLVFVTEWCVMIGAMHLGCRPSE